MFFIFLFHGEALVRNRLCCVLLRVVPQCVSSYDTRLRCFSSCSFIVNIFPGNRRCVVLRLLILTNRFLGKVSYLVFVFFCHGEFLLWSSLVLGLRLLVSRRASSYEQSLR